MNNRGGKRKAGPGKKLGRPVKADAKQKYATKLAPDLIEYLRQLNPHAAEVIDKALRESDDFKEYQNDRQRT